MFLFHCFLFFFSFSPSLLAAENGLGASIPAGAARHLEKLRQNIVKFQQKVEKRKAAMQKSFVFLSLLPSFFFFAL